MFIHTKRYPPLRKNSSGGGEVGKRFRGFSFEEGLRALKIAYLEKRKLRNDSVLTRLFKFA